MRGAWLTYHTFQQRCGRIHSLMAKFSCFKQDLAAAVGHFGLTGSGSTLILFAVSHTLFAQVFSLWFEIRAEATSLLSSAAKGYPCLIPAVLCLGNISRAFRTGCTAPCPFFWCCRGCTKLFCFHLIWASREKSVGKPNWLFSWSAISI